MAKPELIDTHSHLYLEEFGADLDAVINRAEQAGVSRIYLPALDSDHLQPMLDLEVRYPGKCIPMIGLHPCYVKENYQDELQVVEEWLAKRSFAAVGEIGLDYYWDRKFDESQKIAFEKQIALAKQFLLPIVIHSRSSMDDCISMLQAASDQHLRGIFHCFSGTVENANDIIGCGLMLGIGGVLTYKNSGLADVIAQLSLEHLVLETDAPYLTPVPFRGKRNESSYLQYVVRKIAEIKGVSEEVVASITTANARKVFGDIP